MFNDVRWSTYFSALEKKTSVSLLEIRSKKYYSLIRCFRCIYKLITLNGSPQLPQIFEKYNEQRLSEVKILWTSLHDHKIKFEIKMNEKINCTATQRMFIGHAYIHAEVETANVYFRLYLTKCHDETIADIKIEPMTFL